MPPVVLGLDIGGANLKAATADKRAVSVPFPLWKQPDGLPAALAGLVAKFPDAEEFAVTMTGELCDCYETKRQGVNAILTAVQNVSRSYPIRVWSTDGRFLNVEQARTDYLKVAAANWHALATFVGGYIPDGPALLLDIGSTTTDVIPLYDGEPVPEGKTDPDRLETLELLYVGVRRTPVCALLGLSGAAELFATTLDVYLMLGNHPDDPEDTDTADGRPATRKHAHARLSRMLCSDPELMIEDSTLDLARRLHAKFLDTLRYSVRAVGSRVRLREYGQSAREKARRVRVITSGSGEFATQSLLDREDWLDPFPISLAVLTIYGAPVIVVKVGGSLFDHPGLGPGLNRYLDPLLRAGPVWLVPGGGRFADAVREYDRIHHLGDKPAHWLALRSLSVSALFLSTILKRDGLTILDCYDFARADDGRPGSLPYTWDVTSDSIAARAAVVGNASRLVLFKSVDVPPGTPWGEAAARGWVDPHFPAVVAAHGLTVEVVNFRRWLDERGFTPRP